MMVVITQILAGTIVCVILFWLVLRFRSRRSGFEDSGGEWLAEQRRSENASLRQLYRAEGRELRESHHAACDAKKIQYQHQQGCSADRVTRDTQTKMTREEIEARKAELRKKLNR